MKKTALISVYHKENIEKFAKDLVDLGWEIISSGGTAKYLAEKGIKVRDVAELVGGKAILGHRVVTLSREIHAGLLARPDTKEDLDKLARLKIPFIDLVCVDLYPLEEAVEKPDADYNSVIEATDIGGPTLLRSAAKGGRIVICDPEDRNGAIREIRESGDVSKEKRIELAAKAEYVVAKYCLESAKFHSKENYTGIIGEQIAETLYGENAYQVPGKLYSTEKSDPLALDKFQVLTEMAPSYNNTCDIDRMLQTLTHIAAAFEVNFKERSPIRKTKDFNSKNILLKDKASKEFTEPRLSNGVKYFGVAVKHGNCCGASYGDDKIEVIKKVVEGDPRAIFGGLVMFNFEISEKEAEILLTHLMDSGERRLMDGIIAAAFTKKAIERMRRKKDKCRLIANPGLADMNKNSLDNAKRFRYVRGGFLTQPNYTFVLDFKHPGLLVRGDKSDLDNWEKDLLLAWAISATSNSNTITLVKNGKLIGNGVGQQDRVGCCELAIKRAEDAGHEIQDAVAASDSFFPFPDGPEVLINAGIKAIFATSGSARDKNVQKICQVKKIILVQIPDKLARGFFGH
jgi:phosphoribosylaminoimidazolecarboxamide formyltransferase/IMP cyclohydrolase